MTKPICVIYFPESFIGDRERSWIFDYMRYLNGEQDGIDGKMRPSNYWSDYYWFCFYKDGISEPELKVFYEKDFTEIQFNELKSLVMESIQKNGKQLLR